MKWRLGGFPAARIAAIARPGVPGGSTTPRSASGTRCTPLHPLHAFAAARAASCKAREQRPPIQTRRAPLPPPARP